MKLAKRPHWTRAFLFVLAGSMALGHGATIRPLPSRRSDQFIVHDLRSLTPPSSSFRPASTTIPITPDVLVISAERIKRALFQELAIPQRGGGDIHFFLHRSSENNRGVAITPKFLGTVWQYRVDLPDYIEGDQLVRSTVEVVLLEFANRGAGPKSAEIPYWLNEGLTCHLLAAAGPDLTVNAVASGKMARIVRLMRGADTLGETRKFLSAHPPLSFTELSQFAPMDLSSDGFKVFQHSSHLLVNELARLPHGRVCMVNLLRALPYFWNGETAFLHAFAPQFDRLLDAEKWWSVHTMAFLGRDPKQRWVPNVCLEKLDEILVAPAEVRLTTNTLPVRTEVTLQQIVADWNFELQKPVLEQTLNQLTALRYNSPIEIVPVVDAYRQTIHDYLRLRAEANSTSVSKRQVVLPARLVVQNTVKRLDDLLRQREVLRRSQAAAVGGVGTEKR